MCLTGLLRLLRPLSVAAVLACSTASAMAASGDDIVVLSHPGLNHDYLAPKYLRAAFSMHLRTWPDGQPVRFFVLDDNNPVHQEFCRKYLGTFPYVLRTIWDRRAFTGTGIQPEVVHDEVEMRRRVMSTPGAIGYAHRAESDSAIQLPFELSTRWSR